MKSNLSSGRDSLTIKFTVDGNKVCALVGLNIVEGVSGWGNTPLEALHDFVKQLTRENGVTTDEGVFELFA